ncbi:hypothetical protein D3C72_2155720 [compost metagenome]
MLTLSSSFMPSPFGENASGTKMDASFKITSFPLKVVLEQSFSVIAVREISKFPGVV